MKTLMDVVRDLKRAMTMSPSEGVAKLAARIRRFQARRAARARDRARQTYAARGSGRPLTSFLHFSGTPRVPRVLEECARRYLRHEFDLLGSGPVRVFYGLHAAGLESHRYPPSEVPIFDSEGQWLENLVVPLNRERAREFWRLIDRDYQPIDWQIDFKSGYRWNSKQWFGDVSITPALGADIKVPWELARMQHLPQLALVLGADWADTGLQRACIREIRNQVLDFAAANPPCFGVNWACTMDVAIRAVNILLARDLVVAFGHEFDEAFEAALTDIVEDHAVFIADNLEDDGEIRDNHYLADICGWVYTSAYRGDREALIRAAQEVFGEVSVQFDSRGANFEGSTSYHRFTSEMVVWALAILVRCDIEIPPDVRRRVPGMLRFALASVRPDGRCVQFGDHDDGRFVKLVPEAIGAGCSDDPLRPGALSAAIAALCGLPDPCSDGRGQRIEGAVIRAIAGCAIDCESDAVLLSAASSTRGEAVTIFGDDVMDWIRRAEHAANPTISEFELPPGAVMQLRAQGYPEFGAWFWKAPGLFMAVRCGPIGRRGQGSHDHNDQLSLELWVDGRPIYVDPGTYVYTPLPQRRNQYRSVAAHAAPRIVGREPGRLDLGLFQIVGAVSGVCSAFSPKGFAGYQDGYRTRVYRVISIGSERVRIIDWREDGGPVVSEPVPLPFSPGYGRLEATA